MGDEWWVMSEIEEGTRLRKLRRGKLLDEKTGGRGDKAT